MQRIELETEIDSSGTIHLPDQFRPIYGKIARLVVTVADSEDTALIDPMQFSNTIDWPLDGLAFQKQLRDEWP
ncbi:MAG: hypothetical protein HQL48_08425 [Gammaproteobacteria bacterium]|nr:hypothetical protein [Gammaproteobacteria bacterium]